MSFYKDRLSSLVSLETFPLFLLNLNELSSANRAFLFVHEKGTKTIRLFSASRQVESFPTTVDFEVFNRLIIGLKNKKGSKQATLVNENFFNIAGQALKGVINLKTFDLLIVMTKEEFLPFDPKELDFFNTIKNFSTPIIEEMIGRYHKNVFHSLILDTLLHVPYKFIITNRSDLIVFKNFFNDVVVDDFKKNSLNIKISSTLSLCVEKPDKNETISDISHYQRISFLGELLNTLRHELNNPLFGIQLTTQALEADMTAEIETLNDIKYSVERANQIIKSFTNLYNRDEESVNISLTNILRETLTLCKSELKGIKREIFIEDENDDYPINTVPTWVSQVLFNIIINSAQAMINASSPSPKLSFHISTSDNHIILKIADNGPGIPKEIQSKIFDPFFTTKENGTGLGLAICLSLCERLSAQFELESGLDTGTVVKLKFNKVRS